MLQFPMLWGLASIHVLGFFLMSSGCNHVALVWKHCIDRIVQFVTGCQDMTLKIFILCEVYQKQQFPFIPFSNSQVIETY